jgi:hypothetical protein
LSGPENPDAAKLPCRIVKRSVISFLLLPVSGAKSGISIMPEVPNDDRQPEITAVLTFRQRHSRGRLGDFVAEIPHKVLSGVINVQRRHRFLVSYEPVGLAIGRLPRIVTGSGS